MLVSNDTEGGEIMLPPLHPGDVFGLFNVEQAIMSEVYAKVMVDGTVLYRFPRRRVLRLIATYPEIAVDALEQIWRWLTDAFECIEDSAEPLKPRLARTLVRLAAAGEDAVEATHEELAAMVGTRREEVTKALAAFRRRGLIAKRFGRRGIVLVNKHRLANR